MESTKLGKYKILYTNRREYHTLKKEIWGENIYSFKSEKDSPLVIDIGGHIGISVLYFKSLYPNCKIVVFEPNPLSFEVLIENIQINGLKGVKPINMAISSQNGMSNFYIEKTNQGWYSNSSFLVNSWDGKQRTKLIEVECTRLDNYIDESDTIDMLKIDTEGSEFKILNSHIDILKKVENISVEYHPIKGSKIEKLLSILQPYFILEIYHEGKLLKKPLIGKLLTIKGKKRE